MSTLSACVSVQRLRIGVARPLLLIALFCLQSHSWAASCEAVEQGPPDAMVATASGEGIVHAFYSDATRRYGHGILGDSIEAGALRVSTDARQPCQFAAVLAEDSVFEDVTPRLADVTGDGLNDVIVIETRADAGASLAVYGMGPDNEFGKLAATPYIGRSNRWLAPVGVADFNADGVLDVAFVQTPHIGGILRIWSFRDRQPQQLAARPGFSNHRIGERHISGGIRNCDEGHELILPSANWQSTLGATVQDDAISVRTLADDASPETLAALLDCAG